MGISHYLAMTAAEIAAAPSLPEKLAYMACHFSPYGTGLTGFEKALPKKSMLILNDRIPYCGHDPSQIADLLKKWVYDLDCACVLLDFQRADTPTSLGALLAGAISVPVGMPPEFCGEAYGPVFLPPVPPNQSLDTYLKPWTGREIWLETTPETYRFTIDTQESRREILPADSSVELPLVHAALFCHHRIEVFPDRAVFTLRRNPEDMAQLLHSPEAQCITQTVSLYQHEKKLPVK